MIKLQSNTVSQQPGLERLTLLLTAIMLFSFGCDQAGITSALPGRGAEVAPASPGLSGRSPVIASDIPDFDLIRDTAEKKRSFFRFLRPIIEEENARVLVKRKRLLDLYERHRQKASLSPLDIEWLDGLYSEYKVKRNPDDTELDWTALLKRVDALPVEMALIQAAKESGWGSSRFARAGNNLFGQWCFRNGCGLVPNGRDPGDKHEVAVFRSVRSSVRSYIHNLNTNIAYSHFRDLRFEQRRQGKEPDAYTLIDGLPGYSERGEAYIEEIRAMLLANEPYMGS